MQPDPPLVSNSEYLTTKDGFEKLFRTYYQELCTNAFYYLKDQAAAEEEVQDIFVNLWKKRNELEITSSLKSYLYRATRNHCLNVIKHLEIRDSYKKHNETIRKAEEQELGTHMETKELQVKIDTAIDQLPTERKRIFMMSRFEGLKYREIADQLNISVKTVENQMGKALAFLREQLVDYLPLWLYLWFFIERG